MIDLRWVEIGQEPPVDCRYFIDGTSTRPYGLEVRRKTGRVTRVTIPCPVTEIPWLLDMFIKLALREPKPLPVYIRAPAAYREFMEMPTEGMH